MNKIEISERFCYGGSEKELAYFSNNLLVTICGNHLHLYDTVNSSCNSMKVDFGSTGPFTIVGLLQTSNDKNGLMIISCWFRKLHQSVVLEMSPYNFFVNSKLEFLGRIICLNFSNDGKNIVVVLYRRKAIVIEIWDREHSMKMSETVIDSLSHNIFQVALV